MYLPLLFLPSQRTTNPPPQLNRKLATARALLSYEQKCAETRLLEAAEAQRQLRVKLLHLEPECENLLEDIQDRDRYVEEVDRVLAAQTERLQWAEAAVVRYKERNKELEEKLQTRLASEGSERGVLVAELEELRNQGRALEEKIKLLENELDAERKKSSDMNPKLATQRDELVAAQKELAKLKEENKGLKEENKEMEEETITLQADKAAQKDEITSLKTRLQDHVDRLQKAITAKKSLEAEHRAERDALIKELHVLRTELEDAEASAKRAAHQAYKSAVQQAEQAAGARAELEKEISALRAELTETRATVSRIQASPSTSDPNQNLLALQSALTAEKAARAALEKELATQTRDWGYKEELYKATLDRTQAKLAKSVAAKKITATFTAPATKIPITDNPKKRPAPRVLPLDDDDDKVKRPRQERPATSDFSLTPFFTKHAVVTTDSPLTPSVGAPGDDTMIRAERSMVMPAAIESSEPTRLLLAGTNRKRKAPKAAAAAPAAAPIEEEEAEVAPEPKAKPKAKPRAKKAEKEVDTILPGIFDSPSADAVPVPVKKRKKPVVPVAQRMNAFREDDGTGKIVVATGESGERGAAAAGLAVRTGVFTKEISPAKKRPEVLKSWFPGGKK